MTVLLFTASRDWDAVKNVVPGNSSSKPDQFGSEEKVPNSHQNVFLIVLIFYLFIHSFLFIYLFIFIYLYIYLF